MKKRELNIFDAGIAFVMAFVVAYITAFVGVLLTQFILKTSMSSGQISAFWDGVWGTLLQTIYMNIGFVIVFVFYYKRRAMKPILQKPTKPVLKYFGYCVALGIMSLFLLSGALNYFQLLLDKLGFTVGELTYSINKPWKLFISIVSMAVIPAVCEELVFRGVLVNALKSKGQIFAVILSSVMFAMFHFSPTQLLYPLFFGLILAIVYLRTNNIAFPIILHFINNALSILIQYFSGTGEKFVHSAGLLLYSLMTFAIWIYAMIILFKDFKKHIGFKNNLNKELQNITSLQTYAQQMSDGDKTDLKINDFKQKYNEKIFYGSLILMAIIYIIMMMG